MKASEALQRTLRSTSLIHAYAHTSHLENNDLLFSTSDWCGGVLKLFWLLEKPPWLVFIGTFTNLNGLTKGLNNNPTNDDDFQAMKVSLLSCADYKCPCC